MPLIVGYGKIERLYVLVFGDDTEQFLNVPKLKAGTRQNAVDAMYDILVK